VDRVPQTAQTETSQQRGALEEADSSREVQNEYLEWSVQRNNQNKITRIVFCTEGPEYFHFLAQHQRDTLLDLYQQFNPGVSIQEADLFTDSKYNPKNKWNSSTTGSIAHIVECPNTFYSLADLARRATVVRSREDGTVMTNSHELGLGTGTSNSDPAIGIVCNDLVRGQARQLTLADPIGLYIHSVEWGVVDPPAGHEDDSPEKFWKWTRGSEGYVGPSSTVQSGLQTAERAELVHAGRIRGPRGQGIRRRRPSGQRRAAQLRRATR